jgi:GH24 family phage-related lysozyme (muramidase)
VSTWQDFRREIKVSEGSIPHMYLDTVGKVTVGVGNMLPNVAAAQSLPFVVRATLKRATKDEIKTDFDNVSKQMRGQIASRYKASTKLDLPENDINTLLDARIATFKSELKLKFPDFDSYPITVQFALTDMAFNLGTNGVVTKFPTFTKAIKARDWAEAAKQSHRPQVNSHRNKTVKDWLEAAHKGQLGDWNLPRGDTRMA